MLKVPVIVALGVAAVAAQAPSSKAPAGDSALVLQLPGNVPLEIVRHAPAKSDGIIGVRLAMNAVAR
ncbi:MAG TPA: hypothetical protein VN085_01380 [Vicinamibacterales bacterium]|jgi:hypothetical protein|nr:hypothetical protein [Vicinamibacterales bacterium]